jgi:hypothetical protein
MASRMAKYGIEFNFFPYLAGELTIRPTKTKFIKFGEGIVFAQEILGALQKAVSRVTCFVFLKPSNGTRNTLQK